MTFLPEPICEKEYIGGGDKGRLYLGVGITIGKRPIIFLPKQVGAPAPMPHVTGGLPFCVCTPMYYTNLDMFSTIASQNLFTKCVLQICV
jgi:hypothetical protein